jgi:hypothetical protein
MARYWIGVASKDHVEGGVAGGFCQLGHGKPHALRRLAPGDRIIYYSPRTTFADGEPVQAFTAIGTVAPGDVYQAEMAGGFHPFRRNVRFDKAAETPIKPLLDRLSFTRGKTSWGYAFRRGAFEIPAEDYQIIATAMGVKTEPD